MNKTILHSICGLIVASAMATTAFAQTVWTVGHLPWRPHAADLGPTLTALGTSLNTKFDSIKTAVGTAAPAA